MKSSLKGMVEKYKILANGVKIPTLGIGTYKNSSAESISSAITDYKVELIDTAMMYQNEKMIGNAIAPLLKNGTVIRDKIFITTKIWPSRLLSRKDVEIACEMSLKKLQLDTIDLLLMHWPLASDNKDGDEEENMDRLVEAWKAMEQLYEDKKLRAIGVSNFTTKHLKQFLPRVSIIPMVNQYEMHPLLIQEDLTEYCLKNNIQPMAYRTLGQGALLDNETIVAIASKHKKSPAQTILRWALQRGFVLIPKSSHKKRIAENCDIWDFELNESEMKQINGLNTGHRFCADPSNLEGLKDLVFWSNKYPMD